MMDKRPASFVADIDIYIPEIPVRTSMDVYDVERDSVDTGLLNADGEPIRRRTRQPIGFLRFEAHAGGE